MYIVEIFDKIPTGYSDEKEDNSVTKLSDVRKTRLSLAQINKLRLLNDIRKLETEHKIKKVKTQYSAPAGDGGMGM